MGSITVRVKDKEICGHVTQSQEILNPTKINKIQGYIVQHRKWSQFYNTYVQRVFHINNVKRINQTKQAKDPLLIYFSLLNMFSDILQQSTIVLNHCFK